MMPMRGPTPAEKQRDKDLRELHSMVPTKSSVAMSEAEMSHVSHLAMKGLRDTTDADYILYALGSGGGGSTNADRVLATGEFERIAERPGLALLKRRIGGPPVLPPPPPPATPPPPNAALSRPTLPPREPQPFGVPGPGLPQRPPTHPVTPPPARPTTPPTTTAPALKR
jgi:hypothetical protein